MAIQEVTKFKNGKLAFRVDKELGWYIDNDGKLTDSYYFDVVEMHDLYINQINGYQYLVDFNTGFVYELGSYLLQNPLKHFLNCVQNRNLEGKAFYMYPLSKKESKELMHQLDLGY